MIAEVLAALAYGEECGARRSAESVKLAPDGRSRQEQQHVADRERQNWELIEARLREVGNQNLTEVFRPFFDAFFVQTEPRDWIEAQTFHYVGDALVSEHVGRGRRLGPSVETELLAIMGELTVGLVRQAAQRADRLAERLAAGGDGLRH